MVYENAIAGQYVRIRSIEEEDVDFSLEIRQDEKKTKYLHKVENNHEEQLAWIQKQRAAENDYFFIVEQMDGKKVGTIGVYDIERKSGHLGRILMIGNPFQSFEATLLAMRFAYDILGLDDLYGDVDVRNKASLNLSEMMGFHFAEPVYDEALDRYVKYGKSYRTEFPKYAETLEKLIYREQAGK